ncbi:MAG: RagB/SusD family nutrient uptake outer membrane protein, partial [Bacteroidales bacterium]|nr:RagB/SusD family nutrient uptake outer membrane protein [Bacteroidales bacterium]
INEKSADGINTMTFDNETDFSKGYYTLPTESIFALSSSELENRTTELNRLFKLGNTTDNPMLINADRKKELFQTRNSGSNNRFNKLWGEYVNGTGQPQPYLRKYFQNEIAAADSEKSRYRWQFPILRLSEMYLIAMECSEDLTEVNNMFYTYMVARNEQPAPFESLEAAKAEIVNEYRREFIAEGQMFFTYKRFGSSTMLWNNTQIREENYIVPVPASEKH